MDELAVVALRIFILDATSVLELALHDSQRDREFCSAAIAAEKSPAANNVRGL
jgi:hypothetical protein